MPDLKPVGEQVVVVMGATSGIGRAAARRFAAKGAKLVVSARNEVALAALAAELEAGGGQVVAVPAEVTDFEQVRAVADAAVAAYGRLDTWVHLPAASVYARFDEHTPEEFRRVLDVTLLGQVHGAMAALPHLKREGRGALVHVTSAIARRSVPLQSSYAAAKRGTEGFLEALRTELRHDGIGIRVTNVMPASVNTPFFDRARSRLGVKPMGPPPLYQPAVVARALVHAAEHGPRDLVVGGAGRALLAGQRLSPRAMDLLLARAGFAMQRSRQPPPARDALFEPAGPHQETGSFGHLAFRHSAYTWAATHRAVTAALAAAGAAGIAAALRRRAGTPPGRSRPSCS
jgi:NAD(P)-dependent dehydrogenase (short-subunit alcohol dehydrogenase family)